MHKKESARFRQSHSPSKQESKCSNLSHCQFLINYDFSWADNAFICVLMYLPLDGHFFRNGSIIVYIMYFGVCLKVISDLERQVEQVLEIPRRKILQMSSQRKKRASGHPSAKSQVLIHFAV
jgi:hypothetical protein